MDKSRTFLIILATCLFSLFACTPANDETSSDVNSVILNKFIESKIQEPYEFFGLGSYYNTLRHYVIKGQESVELQEDSGPVTLNVGDQILSIGRYKGFIQTINAPSSVVQLSERQLVTDDNYNVEAPYSVLKIEQLRDLDGAVKESIDDSLLSPLMRIINQFLTFLHDLLGGKQWGITIIVFALCIRILFLPLTFYAQKLQQNINTIKQQLDPKLTKIKQTYSGQKAHEEIMQTYKNFEVSPFYELKAMIPLFIQIPFLIAIFNLLGTSPEIQGHSFLWIKDLAYPDAILSFSTHIPFMGNTLNVLPFLMTAVSVMPLLWATQGDSAIKIVLMSLCFFILFYPFPSAMVLYWTCINIFTSLEKKVLKF